MNRFAKTLAATLAAGIFTISGITKQQSQYNNLFACSQELGGWAEHAVQNTHIGFPEKIIINDMPAVASYNAKTDSMNFVAPFVNTRTDCASLAHEAAHHMLDETRPRKGIASVPGYHGPSPDSIRAFAQKWYAKPQQEKVRKDLAQHLAAIESEALREAHEYAPDIRKLITSPDLASSTRRQASAHLRAADRQGPFISGLYLNTKALPQLRLRHAYMDSALLVAQHETSKALNVLDTAADVDSTAYQHLHDHAKDLLGERKALLSDARDEIERDSTYFSAPDEIFARMTQSVVQRTHSHNRYVYDMDTIDAQALIFLLAMEFEGESMFREHVIQYTDTHAQATTTSSTSSEYSTGVSSNSEM